VKVDLGALLPPVVPEAAPFWEGARAGGSSSRRAR
jgi:hypothetical protein